MNRLMYDTCATQDKLMMSTTPVNYMLDITKYERCEPCRPNAGTVGGTNVSHPMHVDRVAIENDLMGRVRPMTKCHAYYYTPDQQTISQGVEYIKPVSYPQIDSTRMTHLPTCHRFFERPALPKMPDFAIPNQCGVMPVRSGFN